MEWARLVPYRGKTVADVIAHYPAGGKRNAREAGRLKRMGVRAGFPDYFVHIVKLQTETVTPIGGLYIELKAPRELAGYKTGPTEKQTEQLAHLAACGYETAIAYGWMQAAVRICAYLGLSCSSLN